MTLSDIPSYKDEKGISLLAGVYFLFGVSIVNAFGGIWQIAYFSLSVLLILINMRFYFPIRGIIPVALSIIYFIVSSGIEGATGYIRLIIEGSIISSVLIYIFKVDRREKLAYLLKFFLMAQFFFAIIMLTIPQFRKWLLEYIYISEEYNESAFVNALLFRGFGISKHHLFGFSVAVSFSVALLITDSKQSARCKCMFFLMGLCLTLLNARIGLLALLISIIWMPFTYSVINTKHFFKIVLFIIFAFSLIYIITPANYSNVTADLVLNWLAEGVEQFFNNNEGQATTLSDMRDMIHIPDTIEGVFFGRDYLCDKSSDCYSDIGFIRLINAGGLILLTMVVSVWLYFSTAFINRRQGWSVFMLNTIIFILALWKGEAFSASDYSRIFIIVSLLIVSSKRKEQYETTFN